ncbi:MULTISPECIES: RNA polymerase sporulation sigma factor SigH [Priestia]|uniref:RNA polymerase sporulation sigma factor SigH n=1 Tax=Priestia TaxID=2800373 RepID=UPI0013E36F8C|nr:MULTISPECIES: RNA polymerase sporulation sigma factor SigH [Priestia]MBE5100239.1 RNA polymerase sporulation sigma factor SigH [Priestia aryabhattai]MDI3091047.1 RNA polymerase sporulation sigma factor SigH [Priestia megaterium]MED3866747.1 RNA polymerase sporulation sigma factor SigH [Priestia megaterium]MED4100985.1 RNA polymerase sporulation sigma factor SigH [Priestia megaterium]MED4146282.1 RNA polymerase sporulation sigma factor SigH [Priestia megaterium]
MSTNIGTKLIENYDRYKDEDLLNLIHHGNEEALNFLIKKYRGNIQAKASTYFLRGADKEDLVQEGMIGLYKAIRNFKGNKMSSFKTFAELCIKRQIFTAVKAATRQKHEPLNAYVSLYKPLSNQESAYMLLDMIAEKNTTNPELLLINQEEFEEKKQKIAELLSKLEQRVWALFINEYSYIEISKVLSMSEKSIDNTIQRIKRKAGRYLKVEKAM